MKARSQALLMAQADECFCIVVWEQVFLFLKSRFNYYFSKTDLVFLWYQPVTASSLTDVWLEFNQSKENKPQSSGAMWWSDTSEIRWWDRAAMSSYNFPTQMCRSSLRYHQQLFAAKISWPSIQNSKIIRSVIFSFIINYHQSIDISPQAFWMTI